MSKTNQAASLLLVLAVVLLASPARAATISWKGNLGSNNWDAGSPGNRNWDSLNLPLTTDDVAFPGTAFGFVVDLNGDRTVNSAAFTGPADYTLNSSTLTLSSGSLTSTGSGNHAINSNVVLGDNGNWNIDISSFLVNGNISGGFQLTKTGMAVLNLQGANTYTGATTINSGELHISGSDERLPDTTAVTIVSGASLRFSDGITETIGSLAGGGDVLFNAGSPVLIVGADGTSTIFSGMLSETGGGTSNLTKIGAGTLTLSGTNTYSGGTTLSAGTLAISTNNNLGSGTVTFDGGLLGIAGTGLNSDGDITNTLTFTGNGSGFDIIEPTHTFTYNAALTHAGPLLKSGSGTLALTNTGNTYTDTILNDGTLEVSADGQLGTGTISGAGNLLKTGAGTLTLSGVNTYTGGTTLSAGTLAISTDSNLGSGGTVQFNGGLLGIVGTGLSSDGDITNTLTFTGNGGGFDIIAPAHTFTYNAALTHAGPLLKNGPGTLALTNTGNTYTDTIISAGTLEVSADGQLGTGAIGGAGNLLKTGAGSLTLNGANTYSGGTAVDNGTLLLGNLDALGTGALTINAGGTVDLDANTRRVHDDIAINDGTLNLVGTTLNASGSDLSGTMPNHNLTVSGSTGLLNATGSALINLNGLSSNGVSMPGADGGSLSVSGGTFNLGPSATLSARGGSVGGFLFPPGLAGSVSFSGGVSTLDGTITLKGQFTGLDGGNVTVSSAADVTLTGTMDLSGFKGRNGISFGGNGQDGGDGGMLLIQGGNFTLNDSNAIVNLLPGAGGVGNNGGTDGLSGAAGSVDVSGGTLTLTAGVIRGGNSTTTLDPIHLIGASINVTGGDLIATAAMTIRGNAAINLSAGSVTATTIKNISSQFNFTGGTFTVDTFLGSLTQDGGNLVPGASAGTTTIAVNYVMNAGTLAIELGGLLAGAEFDQLVVSGNATLGGLLDVSLIAPFTPSLGQSFEIIDVAGSLTGTFSGLPQGALVGNFGGTDLLIDYAGGDGNDVTLLATLLGDFDLDFDVDGADFLQWQRGESPNPLSASDLAAWETNYGTVVPLTATSAAVPEPATGIMLLFGMVAMLTGRRTDW